MNNHRTSSDHDGRYYTKSQVNSLLAGEGVETGSNSNGRYYKHPDGRLVMHCGVVRFTQDPSYRYVTARITLPYTPLGSAEHYVTANPSVVTSDFDSIGPLYIGPPLAGRSRASGGTVVEVRFSDTRGVNLSSTAFANIPVLIESRWK